MKKRVTVVCNGEVALQDFLGLEALSPDAQFVSAKGSFGTTVSFNVAGTTWTTLRRQLIDLSQKRIPALDANGVVTNTGNTMPLLTYSVQDLPGGRPRLHQVEGGLNVGGAGAATQTITLRGENFISGTQAELLIEDAKAAYLGVMPGTASYQTRRAVLRLVAVAKGPRGNKIRMTIEPSAAGSSVVVTPAPDGDVTITVTPINGSSTSTAIAALINGDAVASTLVTATALVASVVLPPTGQGAVGLGASAAGGKPYLYLTGGDGGGLATQELLVANSLANSLRIVADKAGVDGNLITISILGGQGADAVSVSGNDISVTRIAGTTAIGTLASAINANATAAALVTATAVGSGSLGTVAKRWLYGGSAETPSVKIGGAPAVIKDQSDIAMTIEVLKADLITAGVAGGEEAVISLLTNYSVVVGQLPVTST